MRDTGARITRQNSANTVMEQSLHRRSTPGRNTSAASAGGETILLVDDEEGMRIFGSAILEANGYTVLTASDGMKALDIYREHYAEISLVILDFVMPRLDGGQTFLAMKRVNNDVRAFFCSGFTADLAMSAMCREHGLKALKKPFAIDTFLSTVREVLDVP